MSLKNNVVSKLSNFVVLLILAVIGFILIFVGMMFKYSFLNVELHTYLANIGALFLVVGVLQWMFDSHSRSALISELRNEIIGSTRVEKSGICDFFDNSKDVDFEDLFKSSVEVIIGVNYSRKLVDSCFHLIKFRSLSNKKTTVVCIRKDSNASKYLSSEQSNDEINSDINRLIKSCREIDAGKGLVEIVEVDTILRYSFVLFDSRIWVVAATNGGGRRNVPGFMLKAGSSWFDHFRSDILKLVRNEDV